MRKFGFIGSYDKTDLIIYIAKILTELNQRVLVIDSTVTQKARYTVPAIEPSKCYVTNYEGMDVAVGFHSLDLIERYQMNDLSCDYDIVLIDIDSTQSFKNFEMLNAEKNYFVTAFDNYSLKRGLEIIENIRAKNKNDKNIIFSRNVKR